MRHQIVPLLSPLVTTVTNKKSGGAMTGGSGRWSGRHFCRFLCYRRQRQGCNCAAEADRPPAGVTEQGALLSTDGSATVLAWFCAPAGSVMCLQDTRRVWQAPEENVPPWPSSRPGWLFELQHWCMMSIIIILRGNLALTMVY